jgi:hypothetical protein
MGREGSPFLCALCSEGPAMQAGLPCRHLASLAPTAAMLPAKVVLRGPKDFLSHPPGAPYLPQPCAQSRHAAQPARGCVLDALAQMSQGEWHLQTTIWRTSARLRADIAGSGAEDDRTVRGM